MNSDPTLQYREKMWNIATVFVLALIPVLIAIFVVIYFQPQSSLNPFPPDKVSGVNSISGETSTPKSLPPTWTPTPSRTPSPTETAEPVIDTTPTPEIISGTPMAVSTDLTVTETIIPGGYAFTTQNDPQAISVGLYDSTRGCNWMGVAGRAFDIQNRPVTGIRVYLSGELDGKIIQLSSLTGTAVQYGPSGYEFTLSDSLLASEGSLSVRLLDQADMVLSAKVHFDTFEDCSKNLILIDFKEVN